MNQAHVITLLGLDLRSLGQNRWAGMAACRRPPVPPDLDCGNAHSVPALSPELAAWFAERERHIARWFALSGDHDTAYMLAAADIYAFPFVSDASGLFVPVSEYLDEDHWVGDNETGWHIADANPDIDGVVETLGSFARDGDIPSMLSLRALRGDAAPAEAYDLETKLCESKRAILWQGDRDKSLTDFVQSKSNVALPLFPRAGPFFEKWSAVWEGCEI